MSSHLVQIAAALDETGNNVESVGQLSNELEALAAKMHASARELAAVVG